MKRINLAALPLALVTALGPVTTAEAQAMSFAGIDVNEDGVLDMAELRAVFGVNAALAMEQYDLNHDGIVEIEEATRVSMRGAVNAPPGLATATDQASVAGAPAPREGEADVSRAAPEEAPVASQGAPTLR